MGKMNRNWSWVPTLYFAEGIPYVVVMSVAVIMYKRMGMNNSDTALFTSLLGLPWMLKPLWSPFIDIFSTKRRWIISMQALMAAGFAAVGFSLPGPHYVQISFASFMTTAFLSATHDIAADGFYMLALDREGQSFFVGIRTTFYRGAMIVGQGPLVMLAGYFEVAYGSIPDAWARTFYILTAAMAVLAFLHAATLPHPKKDHHIPGEKNAGEIWREFVDTFVSFFKKPEIKAALLFILLYKLPEAQLVKLISPFLLDSPGTGGLGLTTTQVGMIYGTIGVAGLLTGGVIGGIVAARYGGIERWMMPMAWSMSLTCLSFVVLSLLPSPAMWMIYAGVLIEQFGYGFGTTAYILYVLRFASGQRSTSHYAIATGVMSLGLMLPGMAAGFIEEIIGYKYFFIWTMICCTATILTAKLAKKSLRALTAAALCCLIFCGCGNNESAKAPDVPVATPVPVDSLPQPAVPDSVLREGDVSVEEALEFMEKSDYPERYAEGILPKILEQNADFGIRLLRNRHNYFIIVDKPSMMVVLYDRFGRETLAFKMACSKKYGTKHKRRDNRTPEGFFTAEGIYDSTNWLYTDDDGNTSPVKGQFGPRFIRLKTDVTTQIGIHGTCAPWSLGKRVSHGCIRIHNDNILQLVEYVEPGTPIIVNPSERDQQINRSEECEVVKLDIGKVKEKKLPDLPKEEPTDTTTLPADTTIIEVIELPVDTIGKDPSTKTDETDYFD